MRSGKVTLCDHRFELPDKDLEAEGRSWTASRRGTVTHKLKVGGNDQLEIYDYPGRVRPTLRRHRSGRRRAAGESAEDL